MLHIFFQHCIAICLIDIYVIQCNIIINSSLLNNLNKGGTNTTTEYVF